MTALDGSEVDIVQNRADLPFSIPGSDSPAVGGRVGPARWTSESRGPADQGYREPGGSRGPETPPDRCAASGGHQQVAVLQFLEQSGDDFMAVRISSQQFRPRALCRGVEFGDVVSQDIECKAGRFRVLPPFAYGLEALLEDVAEQIPVVAEAAVEVVVEVAPLPTGALPHVREQDLERGGEQGGPGVDEQVVGDDLGRGRRPP